MTYRDEYGREIGSVDSDGTVRDEYGRSTGNIDNDGTVRDEYGRSIGSSEGVSKKTAAYSFFFNK